MAYTTIDNPELYFQAKIHTGTGAELAVTLDGSENMQPDLVWFGNRTQSYSHRIFDSVRGVTKLLYSDLTAAEGTDAQGLKSFNSDGFTIGTDGGVNANTNSIVSWNWKESADAGMDIVGYEGTGSNTTFSHSLSAVPRFFMVKNRESGHNWGAYHQSIVDSSGNAGQRLIPNLTNAEYNDASYFNIAPTSSVFSVGYNVGTNESGKDHIAYLFAEKQGFSKFGSYVGNAANDGPFIFLGFKPAFIMIKIATAVNDWNVWDNKRDPINVAHSRFRTNTNEAENPNSDGFDILSNGFKIRNTYSEWNASGTFVYIAFAESPFVNSSGVPNNAR